MIKELVQDYIYEMNKNEDLSASSFKVLVSLLQKSESSGWSPVVRMSSKKISEDARIGTTTVASSLESLMFSGAISVESKNGAEKSITILFINDVISSSEFSGKTNESVKSVIKRHLNLDEDREKLIVIQNKKETEEENEVFDFIRESGKNSVELSEYTKSKGVHILAQSKSEYNEFRAGNFSLLRFMPVGRVFASVRKVLRFERLKSKKVTVAKETLSISVKALLPANSLNINDLENPSKEELKIYADFLQIPFARSYYYLLLLCLLDRVFFLGRIYKKIKTTTYVDKREETHPKKNSKRTRDEDKEIEEYSGEWVYLLLEKLEEQMEKEGLEVLRKSEQVNGGTVTFIKALREWILYSIESENFHRVRYRALLQNIREFNTWKHPVYSIMHSISKSWNEVYEQKSTNESEENNNPYRLPPSIPEWMVKKQAEENRKKVERDDKIVEEALKLQAELREKGNNINKT